jgi:hypothetical protein
MTVRRARHDRPAVIAIVLFLVAACNSATLTPSPQPSPTPAPPSATPAPSGPPSAAPSVEPGEDDAIYDEIERQVVAMRGLEPTGEVARETIDEAELAAQIQELYHEESPPELVAANERLYKALGLLPPDAGLEDLTIEMLSGGVAGFYRDDQKKLYVVSRSGGVGVNEKITFAHEYDHALQDQHYTIFKDQEDVTNRSDWLLARQAVYEGDASLLMTLWASENLTPEEFQELIALGLEDPSTEMLQRMPAILRETLLYPYTTGLVFVQGQFINGGWDAVDALYAGVPESTEQILHPDKYAAHEAPIEIDLPDDLAERIGPGWNVSLEDTFGEFQLGIWLREAGISQGNTVAEGWGGDRVAVLEGPDGAWAVLLATEWDSSADATEFEAAAEVAVETLDDDARLLPGAGGAERWIVVASDSDVLGAVAGALGLAG